MLVGDDDEDHDQAHESRGDQPRQPHAPVHLDPLILGVDLDCQEEAEIGQDAEQGHHHRRPVDS